MKKLLALVFTVMLMTLVVSSAMAYTFTMSVQCTSASGELTYASDMYPLHPSVSGLFYIYHNCQNGDNTYTNLFHAVRYNRWLCGQKWVTPRALIPIESNAITREYNYTVAARGNTKHYELDGLSRVTLSGYYTNND